VLQVELFISESQNGSRGFLLKISGSNTAGLSVSIALDNFAFSGVIFFHHDKYTFF
jgi:hypothetical protein